VGTEVEERLAVGLLLKVHQGDPSPSQINASETNAKGKRWLPFTFRGLVGWWI
jgi:hypothetical protein